MRKIIFLIIAISFSLPVFAKDNSFKYKIVKNQLEVFGYKLPLSYRPSRDSEQYVRFSVSPDSHYVVILSYLRLKGKYDAWLYNKETKSKPEHINATYVGRHSELKWYSNTIFSVAWAGMGYYTAGIFSVADVNHGIVIEDPIIVNGKRNIYVSYVDDVFKTGIVVGTLFFNSNKKEIFYFKLPETESVIDRYDSVKNIQIIDNKVVVKYIDNGKTKKYEFYPKILK